MAGISWPHLAALMAYVPDSEPTLRGSIHTFDGSDESRRYHTAAWQEGTPRPVFARHVTGRQGDATYRVWRDGTRIRMERPDGSPSLIVGGDTCWRFGQDGEAIASTMSAIRYGGQGTDLLWHTSGERLFGPYRSNPIGAVIETTFLDRQAFLVQMGPPPGKSFTSQWIVDAETGLVLQDLNLTLGSVDEWVEFVVGEELDPALFSWAGETVSAAEQHDAVMADHEADMQSRRDWFAAHVAPLPLRLELEPSVLLHTWDEESGAFQATLGESLSASLYRRLRSDEPWEPGGANGHHWSDDRWDWVLRVAPETLSASGLESLKRQLGS